MQRLTGRKRVLVLAGTAIASALLTLGLVELVGRFFLTPMLVRYSSNQALKLQLANPKDLGIASLYVPHHYYLYSTRPSYRSADGKVRHNSRGCRAEEVPLAKPPGVYRIVAIGGSTTYSTLVRRNEDIFTYKLERLLNGWSAKNRIGRSFEVLNCGVPASSSAENLARYIFNHSEYRADLLMVQQGINDLGPRTFPHISRDYREFSKTWQEFDPSKGGWFVKRLARAATNRFTGSVWTQGINYLVRYGYREKERGIEALNMEKNTPWIFESNTRYLVRLASGDSARVLLLAEHIVADKAVDWRTMPPGRRKATLEHNAVLEKIARETEELFLDVQGKLCACKEIMPDGRHLNEEGDEQKAQVIFHYLKRVLASAGRPATRPSGPGTLTR